jgi:hypothetical protein
MTCDLSVQDCGLVSHDSVKATVGHLLYVAVHIEKRFTVVEIARRARLKLRTVRSYMANEPGEQREPSLSAALSLAAVLGAGAVNEVLALIAFGGARFLDESDEETPLRLVASLMHGLNVLTQLAADGEFCGSDRKEMRPTVDAMIAKLVPFSSAGVVQ